MIYVQDQRAVDMLPHLQSFGETDLLDFAVIALRADSNMTEIQNVIHAADPGSPFHYIMVQVSDCCYRGDGRVSHVAGLLR
jgi:hypothetical protein